MQELPSGWSFFGLSSEYSKTLIDEYIFLGKMVHTSYSDYLKMPTYFRKYVIDKLIDTKNQEKTIYKIKLC